MLCLVDKIKEHSKDYYAIRDYVRHSPFYRALEKVLTTNPNPFFKFPPEGFRIPIYKGSNGPTHLSHWESIGHELNLHVEIEFLENDYDREVYQTPDTTLIPKVTIPFNNLKTFDPEFNQKAFDEWIQEVWDKKRKESLADLQRKAALLNMRIVSLADAQRIATMLNKEES